MAATLTLLSAERGKGNFIEVCALIVLTGNYTQGGITCDLSQLYGQADPLGRTIDSDQLPIHTDVQSLGSVAAGVDPNQYQLSTYTNPSNGNAPTPLTPKTCLLTVWLGATEASTAAFINGVLSDRIVAKMVFPSQQ